MDIGFVWNEMKYQKVLAEQGVDFTKLLPRLMISKGWSFQIRRDTKIGGFG
jgi:hypothetical protein